MAQDAVDLAVKQAGLQHASSCRTVHLPLIGATGALPAARTHAPPVARWAAAPASLQGGCERCRSREGQPGPPHRVMAAGYRPDLFTHVAQHYTVPHRPGAIDTRVAKHLAGGQRRPAVLPVGLCRSMLLVRTAHPGACSPQAPGRCTSAAPCPDCAVMQLPMGTAPAR